MQDFLKYQLFSSQCDGLYMVCGHSEREKIGPFSQNTLYVCFLCSLCRVLIENTKCKIKQHMPFPQNDINSV